MSGRTTDAPRPRSLAPRLIAASVSCPLLVVLCIAFLDRAAASLSHAEFAGRTGIFVDLTHIVDPLLPLSALGLTAGATAAAFGWRPRRVGHTLIACGFAVLISYAVKEELKYAFGRLWPETWVDGNPSWIKDGAYGFYPFHGRTGWSSFPSGHMTAITAPVAVLWGRLPGWRPLLIAPVLAVAVGLFGADYHFIGDMVAGTYLGAACGLGVVSVLREPGERFAAPPA